MSLAAEKEPLDFSRRRFTDLEESSSWRAVESGRLIRVGSREHAMRRIGDSD